MPVAVAAPKTTQLNLDTKVGKIKVGGVEGVSVITADATGASKGDWNKALAIGPPITSRQTTDVNKARIIERVIKNYYTIF